MIISASRRTDIPAFFSDWFFNRINEGFAYIRNPYFATQVYKVPLTSDKVDGIVFWTKNPAPMLSKIDKLKNINIPYYFQHTLTSYDKDIEPSLPSKNKILIPNFKKLSKEIGKERIIWRYDPILLTDRYTIDYHKKYFEVMCKHLAPYTENCVISFLDMYGKIKNNAEKLGIFTLTSEEKINILKTFTEIATSYGIYIETCAEELSFLPGNMNIRRSKCIDDERFSRIGGIPLKIKKDNSQRKECGCVKSTDIGEYDSCLHDCVYCYANKTKDIVQNNFNKHNPNSPLLIGNIRPDDVIKDIKAESYRNE